MNFEVFPPLQFFLNIKEKLSFFKCVVELSSEAIWS